MFYYVFCMFDTVTQADLQEFGLGNRNPKPTAASVPVPNPPPLAGIEQAKLGDYKLSPEEDKPLLGGTYTTIDFFKTPAALVCAIKPIFREGRENLYQWQKDQSQELADSFQTCDKLHPYKLALCAANGSGKDFLVISPFVVWAALTQIRCLTIITSASGAQLSAQTENYIRALCAGFNEYAVQIGFVQEGQKVFHIRQRFIRCNLTGAEIRLFATDEAGKAEGYHPLEPDSKMIIIVNEAKNVAEEIFEALTRCTGFSHWLNVSTPGEPKGSFYDSFCNWPNTRHVTTYDCPSHLAESSREDDRRKYGEHSALYRSKHLALFTTLGGSCIISLDAVNALLLEPPTLSSSLPERIGIDLAAGGDETVICRVKGARVLEEYCFRETDTTITADKLEAKLLEWKIDKKHEFITADDGGVGHAIIDMLVRRKWNIRRVLNQSAATNKKDFGNRGAELWELAKRVIEEKLMDISKLSPKTITQLTTRQYKKKDASSITRITLESKKEAKAHGRPSPDRGDAYVLTFNGFSLDDFIGKQTVALVPERVRTKLSNEEEVQRYWEENVVFGKFNNPPETKGRRIYNSLRRAVERIT